MVRQSLFDAFLPNVGECNKRAAAVARVCLAGHESAVLALLSPVVAMLLGRAFDGENFTPLQMLGIFLVLGSVAFAIITKKTKAPVKMT